MVQRFLIDGTVWQPSDEGFQQALQRAYDSDIRPRCLCMPEGVPMYVSRHGTWLAKRMPLTGQAHEAGCPSFEVPLANSGLGFHWGKAVQASGLGLALKLSFGLRERATSPSLAHPVQERTQASQALIRGLGLRGLTHLLFEQAGLNRWSPAMAGKRHQGVIHKHLMAAGQACWVAGEPLEDRLLVPEPFDVQWLKEVAQRRTDKLRALGRDRVLVCGEIKTIEGVGERVRVWVKHWPDWPLWASAQLWQRVERSHRSSIEAQETSATLRMVLTALLQPLREGCYQVHSVSLMLTTRQWVPLHSAFEESLMDRLVEEGRRFVKPLRYDLREAALPSALLLDAGPEPVALHLLSPFMSERERMQQLKVLEGSKAWVWDTTQPWPGLPERLGRP